MSSVDALVMCGGRGTRLQAATEKPLYEINGRPMIDYVLDALTASSVQDVSAVVSPETPQTQAHVSSRASVIETAGDGYVQDLQSALDVVSPPVVTIGADLPLVTGSLIDRVLSAAVDSSLTVGIPVPVKQQLGLSVDSDTIDDGLLPAGLNVVDTSHQPSPWWISYNIRLAVNVNHQSDAQIAEQLLSTPHYNPHR